MKKTCAVALVFLLWGFSLFAQVEKGDSEIGFMGYYSTMVGTPNTSGGTGSIQLSYGYFLSPRLQIGIGPQVTFTSGIGSVSGETKFSASAFFNYNLTIKSKTVPYIFGQWYQSDFSPSSGDFTDWSFLNVGFGVRNFFTEYAALNSAISYGFSLASQSDMGLLLIMSGLSFFF
jgi:hypothetical protein